MPLKRIVAESWPKKAEEWREKNRAAEHNRSYSDFPPQEDTMAMLQWLVVNGPLVAWAIAVLFTGFTMLTGKV